MATKKAPAKKAPAKKAPAKKAPAKKAPVKPKKVTYTVEEFPPMTIEESNDIGEQCFIDDIFRQASVREVKLRIITTKSSSQFPYVPYEKKIAIFQSEIGATIRVHRYGEKFNTVLNFKKNEVEEILAPLVGSIKEEARKEFLELYQKLEKCK